MVGREVEVFFAEGKGKGKEGQKGGWYRGFVKSLNVEFEDGEFAVVDEPYRFI